jgi:MscS family membrane protein
VLQNQARNLKFEVLQNSGDLPMHYAIRDHVGIESVLQLKEIFDRMMLPLIDSVPDMEMVKTERQNLSSTALGNTRPVRWR